MGPGTTCRFEPLDDKLRLTIDRDLEFYHQRLRSMPNLNYDREKAGHNIIEFNARWKTAVWRPALLNAGV